MALERVGICRTVSRGQQEQVGNLYTWPLCPCVVVIQEAKPAGADAWRSQGRLNRRWQLRQLFSFYSLSFSAFLEFYSEDVWLRIQHSGDPVKISGPLLCIALTYVSLTMYSCLNLLKLQFLSQFSKFVKLCLDSRVYSLKITSMQKVGVTVGNHLICFLSLRNLSSAVLLSMPESRSTFRLFREKC